LHKDKDKNKKPKEFGSRAQEEGKCDPVCHIADTPPYTKKEGTVDGTEEHWGQSSTPGATKP